MFNKTTIIEAPDKEYVPYEKSVTVHQHRAPTDESIRLAKEYEERIWKDISNRVTIDIPSIDAAYVQTEESCYDRARHIFFKVNGRPVRLKYEYQQAIDQHSIFRDIAGEITEQVMVLLMSGRKS